MFAITIHKNACACRIIDIPLQRVFHSIRFKVNKVGTQRSPIFFFFFLTDVVLLASGLLYAGGTVYVLPVDGFVNILCLIFMSREVAI